MRPETLADLHRAGLLRLQQPRRWGGMEFDFVACSTFRPRSRAAAPPPAGTSATCSIHHWMLALYDERAQQEVWGENPDALIASGIAYPQGSGRRVDGGFIVSGRWNFSSGVNAADWNMLAVTVRDGDQVVDHRMCLLHKRRVRDRRRLARARHAQHRHHVGGGEGRVRARAPRAVHVRPRAAASVSRARGAIPNPCYRVPLAALGAHGLAAPASATRRRRWSSPSRRSRSAAPTTPPCACATSRRCSCASARAGAQSTRRAW